MKGMHYPDAKTLLSEVKRILAEFPAEKLSSVFDEWMDRLQKCVDLNGEYVEPRHQT